MNMKKIIPVICIVLAAGCVQQKSASVLSFQCVPEVLQTHEVGGTLIGPDGGMYDGDKHGQELRISDGSSRYTYDWLLPPCEFAEGKTYTFQLNMTNHQIKAIHDLSGKTIWVSTNSILSASRDLLRIEKEKVEQDTAELRR
jgi:hypothetical protein